MKSKYSGEDLSLGFPEEFGRLLSYSRSLEYGQLPDYTALTRSLAALGYLSGGPLDWTPKPLVTQYPTDEPSVPDHEDEAWDGIEGDSDSYCGVDIDMWAVPGKERNKALTLPSKEQVGYLDRCTPLIIEVIGTSSSSSSSHILTSLQISRGEYCTAT